MKPEGRTLGIFLLIAAFFPPIAFAETVELVTYYPSTSTGGDLHATSLTVGTTYANETPADGQAFIYDRLGIGPGFTAAAPPIEVLEVVGNILTTSSAGSALFKANRGVNTIPNGLQVQTNKVPQWTIGSRAGSEGLQLFSDADNATRLFIAQGTGNVGIGTTAPSGWLHVKGTDDALSNILFTPGMDTAAAGTPEIRVGIGPGVDTTPPVSTLQVNGSIGFQSTVVTGNVTLNSTHNVVLCNNGGTMTVTLPPAAQSTGRTYYIKKISNNTVEVVIAPNGAEGIDGALSLSLYVQNDAARIYCAGGTWYVIGDEIRPHMAKMTRDTVQSIPAAAFVKVNLNNKEFDIGGIASTSTSKFTIRRAGRYLVTGYWQAAYETNGHALAAMIYKNGVCVAESFVRGGSTNAINSGAVTDVLDLAVSDYIEMYLYSDDPINTDPSAIYKPRLSVVEQRP